ncbi:hypothetical protein RSAG8_04715, partial [Rhizoctonia solani AG-8 WAC10335]
PATATVPRYYCGGCIVMDSRRSAISADLARHSSTPNSYWIVPTILEWIVT